MLQNEKFELECLILEYKDRIEVAEQNDKPTSALKVTLEYLKDLKRNGEPVPNMFIEAMTDVERASVTFSLLSRNIA